MRITIEPTQPVEGGIAHTTVAVSQPDDDLNIGEVVDLLRAALIAWGFSEKSVDDEIGPQ
jgi:hypothetical protein